MCSALITAYLGWLYLAGPGEVKEQVSTSREYHLCLVVHNCLPDPLVETVRSPVGCREIVVSPGTPHARRLTR